VLLVARMSGWLPGVFGLVVIVLAVAAALIFNIRSVRHKLVSTPLLNYVRAVLPPMSDTEREAIDAGTVWWEAELFRGAPDWNKLVEYPEAKLTAEEQAFVDGPVEELCSNTPKWL